MKINKKLLVTLLLSFSSISSHAYVRDYLYLGAGVGPSFNNYSFTVKDIPTGLSITSYPSNISWIGNIFLGYGYTFTNCFYLAGELGTNFPNRTTSVTRSGVINALQYQDQLGLQDYITLDLLPGYRGFDPSLLVYGRIGASFSRMTISQNASGTDQSFSASYGTTAGGRIGIGATYSLTLNLGLSADYYFAAYPTLWVNQTLNSGSSQYKQQPHVNYLGLSLLYSF